MSNGLPEFIHVSAMTVQLWCNDERKGLSHRFTLHVIRLRLILLFSSDTIRYVSYSNAEEERRIFLPVVSGIEL